MNNDNHHNNSNKKGAIHNQNEFTPFIGSKWRYNYGITVLHRVVD